MNISISKLKLFKACRRAYEFKYIEGLEPRQKADALETGSNYHAKIESLYKEGTFTEDFSKESAMAKAFEKYIYPLFQVKGAEQWFEYNLTDQDKLIGIVDAIGDGFIVEHKTTGENSLEEYEYNLQWDEQLLAYMLATGFRKVYYTVVKKPTIRQKQSEDEEAYYKRMVEWYNDDTINKIRVIELTRSDEEVEEFRLDLIRALKEIKSTDYFYRNTAYCTKWGRRCEYSSICMNYDPKVEYIEFEKKEVTNGTQED